MVVYVGFEFFQAFEIFGQFCLEIIIANEYFQCRAEVLVRLSKSYLKPIRSNRSLYLKGRCLIAYLIRLNHAKDIKYLNNSKFAHKILENTHSNQQNIINKFQYSLFISFIHNINNTIIQINIYFIIFYCDVNIPILFYSIFYSLSYQSYKFFDLIQ